MRLYIGSGTDEFDIEYDNMISDYILVLYDKYKEVDKVYNNFIKNEYNENDIDSRKKLRAISEYRDMIKDHYNKAVKMHSCTITILTHNNQRKELE